MKTIIKKLSKFIVSRALYFVAGILIAIVISVAYAAVVTWPAPQVSSGNPLTAELWNTFAENLDDLNSRPAPPAQTLSISGQTLSISSGNSVTLPKGLSIVKYSGTGCGNCPCGSYWSTNYYYCYMSCLGRVCVEVKNNNMCGLKGNALSWTMYCIE